MTRITYSQSIAGAFLALCLATVPASALNASTYVSGKGTDVGGCATPATACRSFGFAIAQTAASGTIIAIDPANYGPVIINKSISIVADGGGPAGIYISTGNGITIKAGVGDNIHLRGLTIEGLGSKTNGIQFNSGGNLAIENCVIRNFTNFGILIQPTGFGIVNGVLSNVLMNNNDIGILVDGEFSTAPSLSVTIVDSVASDNFGGGVGATSLAGHPTATVLVRNSVVSYNNEGLSADINAVIRVAHSVVTRNTIGVNVGTTVFSYGDNDINGNVTDVSGTLTPLAQK